MSMDNQALKPLLVVEDNPGLQKQLKWAFEGYAVHLAKDRKTAIKQLIQNKPAVVTLDLGLPPDPTNASEGLLALEEILKIAPYTKVIVVTGNNDRDNALKAISLGAYDFYQKPVDPDILSLIVDRASNLFSLEEEHRHLLENSPRSPIDGILCASQCMLDACRMVEKIAPSDVTALILGASGTGKELFARALHHLSSRHAAPFVAVNCAAIPENLLESELFGYEKGAFTGATKTTDGKIWQADGGTLFLDEIGDMPLPLQAKILRFLQERVIERVGGRQPISVDVRIVSATHQNLEKMMRGKTFREDLFYRISEIVINIPALKDREDDSILLAKSFLEKFRQLHKSQAQGFTEQALAVIAAYDWPGNVRELENKIKRAVVLSEGKKITASDLGLEADNNSTSLDLRQAREETECRVINKALALHENNMSHAAAAMGISRPSLYNLMKKLRMESQ
ncbi:MAG: PEP-CTERM-box response regulator transcription factor [Gammaproteobacteria bacterium]